jgi:hypothetical protein
MFEREVMNADYDRTGRKRWSGKLNVEHIDRVPSELSAKSQWDPNQGRVWQGGPNGEIWPPVAEAFHGLSPGNVQRVTIDGIDLGESFD